MKKARRKLTNADVLRVRIMFRDGMLQASIADMFGINQTYVSSIVTGRSYSNVPWPISIASCPRKSLSKFPGYEFDNQGNAYSYKYNKKYGRQLKLQSCKKGYLMVAVTDEYGKQFLLRVNRVICTLFHDKPPTSFHQARHLNGIKTDNRAVNLSWGTQRENSFDKIGHGTIPVGIKVSSAKLTESDVKEIRASTLSGRKLAKIYRVSQVAIRKVINRDTWKHI